ncbi:MAG: ATP-binding protein [Eggerthella lenta]
MHNAAVRALDLRRGGGGLGGRVTATFANDVDAAFPARSIGCSSPSTPPTARSGERSGGLAIARSLVGQMGGTLDACLEQREGERWLCLRLELAAIG